MISKVDGLASKMRSSLAPLLQSAGVPTEVGEPKTTDAEAAEAPPAGQPALLNPTLRMAPHQIIGLSWLHGLHRNGANGILADEMGLGKTVQTIALLATLLAEGDVGPHLVVAPSSVLENWRREFERWCPALRVLSYIGSESERHSIREDVRGGDHEFEIVLCSYSLFSSGTDSARRERHWLSKTVREGYLVLDEAQQIKNAESARYKSLAELRCTHRLLLTGTPVENSPKELLALLGFLVPNLFDASVGGDDEVYDSSKQSKKEKKKQAKREAQRKERLSSLFGALSADDPKSARRAKRIRSLIGPFVLRRLKCDVLEALPPKTEEVVGVALTESQQAVYREAVERIAAQHREREAARNLSSDFITSSFTLLRKAALHPLLLTHHFAKDAALQRRIARVLHGEGEFGDPDTLDQAKVLAEVQTSSDLTMHLRCLAYPRLLAEYALPASLVLDAGKMVHLTTLLPKLRADGHRVLIFSQWTSVLDLIGLALDHIGMRFVRFDGSTQIDERNAAIDEFDRDESITCFLLTTRAGGLGINLTSADTCIIYDSDFNPAADKQAMDRCHRMGQTRPVRVIKLAAQKTVDERIVQIAASKAGQRAMLFDEGANVAERTAADAATHSGNALMGSILRETIFGPSERSAQPNESAPQVISQATTRLTDADPMPSASAEADDSEPDSEF